MTHPFLDGDISEATYLDLRQKLEERLAREQEGTPAVVPHAKGAAGGVSPEMPGICCVSGKPVADKEYFLCKECGQPCLEEFRVKHPEGLMLAMCRSCGDPVLAPMWEKKAEEKRLLGVAGDNWECDLGDGVKFEMVWVDEGEFMMGGDRYRSEGPIHRVQIPHGFWLGKYSVTQAQYKAVMGENPSKFKDPDHPVERVSWEDAQHFIGKLQKKLSIEGVVFRLPSEAEWEYSCRAGSTGDFCFGDDEARLGDYGWYTDNSGRKTHPVGRKRPNAWGLYDMHGNVREWCEDESHDGYDGAPTDGRAWLNGDGGRVCRGGAMDFYVECCRSAYRYSYAPSDQYDDLGFRLLRTAR